MIRSPYALLVLLAGALPAPLAAQSGTLPSETPKQFTPATASSTMCAAT